MSTLCSNSTGSTTVVGGNVIEAEGVKNISIASPHGTNLIVFFFFCDSRVPPIWLLQVYNILDEFILSGEVEESSKREILERIRELEKLD